jgi:endonuclease/exonuclease/phosphatase (EEP) superfamily protein YafD
MQASERRLTARAVLAVLSGPVAVGLIFAVYQLVSDRTFWGEWIAIWPPVGWGFLFLVRAAVLRLQGHSRAAVATLLATLAFLGLTTEWPPLLRAVRAAVWSTPSRARAGDAVPLRVVIWNVSGNAPLADIETLSPDLCLFQEIGSLREAVRRSPAWTAYHVLEGFDPGTASRYPLRSLPSERVGPWAEPVVALVDLPRGRRLVVVNVRLMLPGAVSSLASPSEWGRISREHAARLAQFPRLAVFVARAMRENRADGAILAGDFNTPGGMSSVAPLGALLRDVWPIAGIGWGATMTAEMPLSRIDQCWVSSGIVPIHARVERRGSSDHRLLVVDLLVGG